MISYCRKNNFSQCVELIVDLHLCFLFQATPSISAEQIQKAEEIVNNAIRDARNVFVTVYKEDAPEEQLKEVISIN